MTRSLRSAVARALATWFGCGRSPVAPGTVGSLGALPLYFVVRGAGTGAVVLAFVVVAVVGVWAAGVVAGETGRRDPQSVVIDEVAGTLLTLAAAPPSSSGVLVGVVLFRFFDIVKLWPARRAEQLPSGWGIVADDVVAALQASALVSLLRIAEVLP